MRTAFLSLVTFFIAVSCIPAETSPLSDELDELDKVLTMSDDYDGIKVRLILCRI
ncbi:MAG: hypothetical protein J6A22_02120 [Bacteroidales bacterium]|nr:hypothetical protein [Bacteroidales bacterium]